MKRKQTSFKKGNIVYCTGSVVLVTGAGDKEQGDSLFSGVVIMTDKGYGEELWPVGMYSRTWETYAFKKVNIPLSKAVKFLLNI